MQLYFEKVVDVHCDMHGPIRRVAQGERKQRRDAGGTKTEANLESSRARSGAPISEAGFARKRAKVIDALTHMDKETIAAVRNEHVLGTAIASAVGQTVAVSATVQKKIEKRKAEASESYLCQAKQAKHAQAKLKSKSERAFVGFRKDGMADGDSAPAGVALLAGDDSTHVRAALQKARFKLTFNVLDFAEEVLRARCRAPRRGHLVLVPNCPRSDFSASARLAAALLGTHMSSAADYLAKGRACGCYFKPSYIASGPALELAVSDDTARAYPTVPKLLLRIAQAPSSRIQFVRSARALEKRAKNHNLRIAWKTRRIFASLAEISNAKGKYKALYANGDDYLRFCQQPTRGVPCPGFC